MKTNTELLAKAYDAGYQEEWNRLTSPAGRIEFTIIKYFLNQLIGKESVVYDIGCGPGRYAAYLLEKGFKVATIDLSQKSLEAFHNRISKHFKQNHLFSEKCCATKLDWIKNNSADVILLMGPMYHLISRNERLKAVEHGYNKLKSGGYLFSTWMKPLTDLNTNDEVTETLFQGYNVMHYRCKPQVAESLFWEFGFKIQNSVMLDENSFYRFRTQKKENSD